MLQADAWNQELGGTAQLSPGFSLGECQQAPSPSSQ